MIYRTVLPFPVSVNQMYAGGSGQQRFMGKKYKAWLLDCPRLEELKIGVPIHITYKFFWPCKRKRDGANYMKSPLDYLVKQQVILDDDYSIVASETWAHGGVDKANPRVEIIFSLPAQ